MVNKYLKEISERPLQFSAILIVIVASCVGYLFPNLEIFAGIAIAFSVLLAASKEI